MLYEGNGPISFPIKNSGIEMMLVATDYEADDVCEWNNLEGGPILGLTISTGNVTDMFGLGVIPENITELAGGEICVNRFEEVDKQWHLNSEN